MGVARASSPYQIRDIDTVRGGSRLRAWAEQTWPIAEVRIELGGREAPMLCLISEGGPPILGVVALESLGLAVDPVARRLVPSRYFVIPSVPRAVPVPA